MKVDRMKFQLALAQQCKSARDLRPEISASTAYRVKQGRELGTKTVGRLAKALGVSVEYLIEEAV